MHCTASMLQYRKESIFNLGSAETKLLYTLHWVLLDAMDECSLEEKERGNTDYTDYNIPLASITTFVYLFAPICANVRETDFDANMRLVNGRKIWAAMWEYRHPDVDSFTAQVKPKLTQVRDISKKGNKDAADDVGIFMGDGE